MSMYGTPDDPYGWRAIAAAQQKVPNFGGLPPELLYALAGQTTPDQLMGGGGGGYGMDQQQQSSPLDDYLNAYGQDYTQQALAYGDVIGVNAQKPQYVPDDLRAIEKVLADRSIAGAKAAYGAQQDQQQYNLDLQKFGLQEQGAQLDQQKFGLAQDAAQRQAYESAAQYGSPENDLMFLSTMGVSPEELIQEISTKPDETYDAMGTYLNLVDDSGSPNWRTPENINRLMGVIRLAQQKAGEAQDVASGQSQAQVQQRDQMAQDYGSPQGEAQRWQKLGSQDRAREMYMRLTQPNQEFATDPDTGTLYTGQGALARMNAVRANRNSNPDRFMPRPSPSKSPSAGQTVAKKPAEQKKIGWETKGGFWGWAASPREYAKKHPESRTPWEWFIGH